MIFLFAILLLFAVGLVTALFISHSGWVLSLIAFLAFAIASLVKGNTDGLVPNQESDLSVPSLRRVRSYIRWAIPILGGLFLIALVAMFSQRGVCDTDNLPVLAHRERYVLVSHGSYWEVSPLRYYIAGISFTIGWHSLPLIGVLAVFDRFIQKEIARRGG